ncbi:2-oxoacid:acceptor oxidoreductase family protein [Evansella tamaricis]|uniref:2-oxoacid:acceptor oxidoreductase family protein n=1 Tax=Evansella tamaricis TaxID=2069301 RepID=A0ABS6JLK0_9BACI|nr:2-oxoacid:acceptor oxidoreductase family protein [Evansella tamaricis]MBU9714270.1 2-oxoacid:acceptor oxidoreductase family protein [Evansella tamaricis]
MKEEIIIAGFGGQGVMSMGQLLAFAGMKQGKEVSWLPSYGPEQRGGTANVSVVISDSKVGSPIIDSPTTVILLNNPSFEKFEKKVVPGGNILTNGDLVNLPCKRNDISLFSIQATTIAEKLGNHRVAGMVILGAFIEKTGILSKESLVEALLHVLGKEKQHLIPVNIAALESGMEMVL